MASSLTVVFYYLFLLCVTYNTYIFQTVIVTCNMGLWFCRRSCDSTFGLGSLNNEDELCWFLSSNSAEGSEDALKSGIKFSCSEATAKSLSENGEASKLENVDPLTNGLNKKGTSMGDNISSPGMDAGVRDTLGHLSVVKGSDAKSEIGDDLTLKEQVCMVSA